MRTPTFVAATLLVLTLTGCTNRSAAPAPTTRTTTTTSTTTTTTTTTPPATAADGANLQACQDGTCEVQIKTGDVLTIKGETVTISDVSAAGLTFVMADGTVASVGGPGSTIGIGDDISIDVVAHDG